MSILTEAEIEEAVAGIVMSKYANTSDCELARFRAIESAVLEKLKQQEPVMHQFQDRNGNWRVFLDERHYDNTVADGSWPIRALYTAPVPTAVQKGGSCEHGCTNACEAKNAGCASECPALPWQPGGE